MSCISDTKRCPYCRGDMLTTEHMSSGARWHVCGACGAAEDWFWDDKGMFHHTLSRPTAYVSLMFPSGCREFKYFGKHPYQWVKDWKKNVSHINGIILPESFGVVYNQKHKKLKLVFGTKPPVYPDAYYEDDAIF